jgi:hypothetical protein
MLKQNIIKIFAVLLLAFGSTAFAQKPISIVDLIIDRTEYRGQTVTLRCDYFYPLSDMSLSCRDTKTRINIYARVRGFNKKQLRWLFENCFSSANESSPNCANVLLVGVWDGDYIQEGHVIFRQ